MTSMGSDLKKAHPVILQHDTGQLPAENRACVDPDPVGTHDRGTLNRVAMDHHIVERAIMFEEGFADPPQIMRHLLGERHPGPDAGMDEQIRPDCMVEGEFAELAHLPGRDEIRPVARTGPRRHAPAVKRVDPAILRPDLDRIAIAIEGRQEQFLVIAHQIDGGNAKRAAHHPFDNPGAIRSTVDIVAEMDQQRIVAGPAPQVRGDQAVEFIEHVTATMHIANGIDAVPGRQASRR